MKQASKACAVEDMNTREQREANSHSGVVVVKIVGFQ